MTLKDLKNAGVTLPPHQWGKHPLSSTVNRPGFVLSASGAIAGAAVMFLGEGGLMTWLGALLFLVSLFCVTVVSFRAVAPNRKPASKGRST
jgi:hypothetical protein